MQRDVYTQRAVTVNTQAQYTEAAFCAQNDSYNNVLNFGMSYAEHSI